MELPRVVNRLVEIRESGFSVEARFSTRGGMKCFVGAFVFLLLAAPAGADVSSTGADLQFYSSQVPWRISFPKQRWTLGQEKRRPDGDGFYYLASNDVLGLNFSVYIDKTDKCSSGSSCRTLFWSNPGPGYAGAKDVKQFDRNGFAAIQLYMDVPALQAKQGNLLAHEYKDGYWIDIHISRMSEGVFDPAPMLAFLDTIAFKTGTPSVAAALMVATGGEKSFSLSDRGSFKLKVPAGWTDLVRQQAPGVPPTITFQSAQGSPSQVLVTPMWSMRPDKPLAGKIEMKQQVESSIDRVRNDAVEKDIKVVEFNGTSGAGYYFSVTDRAPKPGEFKYMSQGMMRIGELLVTFTILTNDGQQSVPKDALTMLQGAVHVAR